MAQFAIQRRWMVTDRPCHVALHVVIPRKKGSDLDGAAGCVRRVLCTRHLRPSIIPMFRIPAKSVRAIEPHGQVCKQE